MTHPTRRLGLLLLSVAVLAVLGASTVQAQDGPPRIAVVDLDRIAAESPGGKQLQGQLEAFQEAVQTEGSGMEDNARDIRKRIVEGANSLSEEKLNTLEKEYEDQTIAIRRFRDDKQREFQKMQAEGLQQIEQQLEPVFRQIQEEEGYDLILNYVPGVVVMASKRIDITDQVVARLNAAGGG